MLLKNYWGYNLKPITSIIPSKNYGWDNVKLMTISVQPTTTFREVLLSAMVAKKLVCEFGLWCKTRRLSGINANLIALREWTFTFVIPYQDLKSTLLPKDT